MRTIFKIIKSELNSLFYSPIAWLVLVIYTFQLSYGFTEMLNGKLINVVFGQQMRNLTFDLFISGFGSPLFKAVISSLFLYIPLLTMGLMSKEYSSGSIKLLLSSPITEAQIVLGKYFSMLVYGLIMISIVVVYVIFGTFAIKDIDLPVLISGLAGIYLLFCFYSAIGLFFSCITSYQIIAALATLVAIIFFQLISGVFQTIPFIRDITFWLGIGPHGLISGLLSSDHVIYFLLMSSMFVVFSILNIRFQRQNISYVKKGIQYACVFLVTVAAGYITSRPQTTFYWDVTRHNQATLTPKTQDILARFKGDPVLTSYVNFMGNPHLVEKAYPANINGDKLAFNQYVRFKPNMKMKYVYYYENVETCHACETHDSDEFIELSRKTARINSISFGKALTGVDVRKIIDGREAENGLVRTFEVDSLPKAYIRMFPGELSPYPGETEISTALTVMLDGPVKIGFISGQGERDLEGTGDKDYGGFPNARDTRSTLINRGFYPETLELDEPIPADIDIIVIADMKVPFSKEEFKRIESYVERGGNMVINTDINRKEQMSSLLDLFGVEAIPGILAQKTTGYSPASVFTYFTENSTKINPDFLNYKNRRFPVIMPGSVGLVKKIDKGYDVEPVLEARQGTWNVTKTSNPDEIVEDSIAAAKTTEIYSTAMSLTKEVGGKEQRILIFGDADWFSKGELNAGRSFFTGNYSIITNMFKWMSYDKYPMSFNRPPLPDNELHFKFEDKEMSNFFFLFLFPFIWLACGSIVWYKRRIK
jgi:ABC-2 type transport system permease protein